MSDDIAPLRKWGNCFAKAEDELEFGLSETLDIGKTRIVWCEPAALRRPARRRS